MVIEILSCTCVVISVNIGPSGGPSGGSKKGLGTGKETLRLRSKGPATVEVVRLT